MLEIEDLHCRIQKSKILNGASLKLTEGQTIGLIGPNGSGKTTLFNCISGFNNAYKGKVVFQKNDITELEPYARAHLGIGRVFQNFGIFKELSVVENILTAIESRQTVNLFPWSKRSRENYQKAMSCLEQVNLQDKAKSKASNLSGGQLRLLEIVRTLTFGADLFLLDEPTAGVSPKMKKDVAALICKVKEMNKSILIIEHDISFIQEFCDLIAVLDGGKIVMIDTPQNVKNSMLLREIYFG